MDLPEPYVQSDDSIIDFKLKLLQLQEGETLLDLGCGNAKVLIRAYELYKTKGVGCELREEVIKEAKSNISNHGLEGYIKIEELDFQKADITQVDAVILYLTRWSLGELSLKLEKELKPGTRVITHDFDIPAWQEKENHKFINNIGEIKEVYLYEV